MTKHTITIEIQTDADLSLVLDLALSAAEKLVQELEDHGEDATFSDDNVVVESDWYIYWCRVWHEPIGVLEMGKPEVGNWFFNFV